MKKAEFIIKWILANANNEEVMSAEDIREEGKKAEDAFQVIEDNYSPIEDGPNSMEFIQNWILMHADCDDVNIHEEIKMAKQAYQIIQDLL